MRPVAGGLGCLDGQQRGVSQSKDFECWIMFISSLTAEWIVDHVCCCVESLAYMWNQKEDRTNLKLAKGSTYVSPDSQTADKSCRGQYVLCS